MAKVDLEKQALEQEVATLRQKLAEQERIKEKAMSGYTPRLQNEINKIRQSQKGKSPLDTIIVKGSNDHKNISLWTRDGQRIGPLHPENAIRHLNDMAAKGVILTFEPPTPEEVNEYKQSAEYKAYMEWEAERRARKNKSRKAGQMEKILKEIAKMNGTTVEAINTIARSHEVKKLSEARG